MNPKIDLESVKSFLRRKPVLIALTGVAALAVLGTVINQSRAPLQESAYYEVKRGDFLISIVEGGNIEAVKEVVIRSDVEGTARIVFIVKEGTTVAKSNLLVELDSSASSDAVNQQQINVEKAQFALIQAEQQLGIQKSMVDSEIAAAKLKVEFAESDLEKFAKGEALRLQREAEVKITNVLESLKIAEERLTWTEKLYAKGYETKANLDKDRLTVSQNTLSLELARMALWLVETFDVPKQQRQLEAAVKEAKDELERVKLQGERKLAQFEADVATQKSTLDLSKKKLERDIKQLAATKIYAPQDGLVVYANSGSRWSSESLIEEGAMVRYRQELIKLPDISEMKLLVRIHESHINQIQCGQPAYVVLDAMPDRRFMGMVNRVAPLPDSQSRHGNPNLKVYPTEILIQDQLPNVKPGVSARAEVVITNLQNVLKVPIQAVTTRKGQQVVFLAENPPRPVPVTVGMYNIKFIEIISGLEEGARILLSPPFDTETKDLGGSVIESGETVPQSVLTNRPVQSPQGFSDDNGGVPPGGRSGAGGPNLGRDGPGAGPDMNSGGPRGPRRERTEGGSGPGSDFGSGGGSRPPGGGSGAGGRFNREEMLKRFDTNKDGELDDNERNAMREQFSRPRRPEGSTNAPSGNIPIPDGPR